jgi:hypothetical protein
VDQSGLQRINSNTTVFPESQLSFHAIHVQDGRQPVYGASSMGLPYPLTQPPPVAMPTIEEIRQTYAIFPAAEVHQQRHTLQSFTSENDVNLYQQGYFPTTS